MIEINNVQSIILLAPRFMKVSDVEMKEIIAIKTGFLEKAKQIMKHHK